MGKRSGVLDHDADILRLTLAELDAEIARCETRRAFAPDATGRKAFDKRIHWLNQLRLRHPALMPD